MSGQHQDGLCAADGLAEADVGDLVPDHDRLLGGQAESGCQVPPESGARFAALALFFGRVRAVRGPGEADAFSQQQFLQPRMDPEVLVGAEKPASDAALVAGQVEAAAKFAQTAHGRGHAGDERDQVRVAQVVALFDERSVAIEKNGVYVGHICPCRRWAF